MSELEQLPSFKKRKASKSQADSLNLDLELEPSASVPVEEAPVREMAPSAGNGKPLLQLDSNEMEDSADKEINYKYFIKEAPFCASVLGIRPVDDFLKTVASWLFTNLPLASQFADSSKTNIEIEVKLGWLIDTTTDERLSLPIGNDAVVHNRPVDRGRNWFRFVSDMSMLQHEEFNKFLNERVPVSESSHFPGKPIIYKHTKEIDFLFGVVSDGREKHKIRLSFDANENKLVPGSCIVKEKVADLDIYCASSPLDFRISINTETQHPLPSSDLPVSLRRHKDRLSYQHELVRIDLTQVVQDESPALNPLNASVRSIAFTPEQLGSIPKRHELEIEFTSIDELLSEKAKLAKNQPNRFLEMVDVLVNNARLLSSRASSVKSSGLVSVSSTTENVRSKSAYMGYNRK